MATEPSIAMIPSGYKASKIYSTLPTNGDADLTFSRSTVATRINAQGLIEEMAIDVPRLDYTDGTCPSLLLEPQSTNLITYPISFGNSYWTKNGASIEGDSSTAGIEQVTNGDFATDSDWDKGVDWVISGGVATSSASSNSFAKLTTIGSNLVVGKTYLITYTVLNYVSNTVVFTDGVAVGNARNGNGTYSEYYTARGTEITFRSYGQFNGSIDNVSVKEVQGFSAPSVDNPTSAFKLVEDTSTGLHYCIKTFPVVSETSYTYSIIAKYSGSYLQLSSSTAFPSSHINYDLQSGTAVTGSGSATGTVEELSNGFYRCTYTDVANATSSSGLILPLLANSTTASKNPSYTGNGTSGVYIFGAQLEALPYATSLMLPNTEGSTVTRVGETASKTWLSSYINSSEGTWFFNIADLANGTGFKQLSISNESNNNNITIFSTTVQNKYVVQAISGGSTQVNVTLTLADTTAFNKIAIKWKLNDFAIWINGVEVYTNSSYAVISAGILYRVAFSGHSGASVFYGNCKDLRVYKTALTDTELTTLTTI